MPRHLVISCSIFSAQIYFNPKEIARVLHRPRRDTKQRTADVRRLLGDGSLIPGLRKPPGQKR